MPGFALEGHICKCIACPTTSYVELELDDVVLELDDVVLEPDDVVLIGLFELFMNYKLHRTKIEGHILKLVVSHT